MSDVRSLMTDVTLSPVCYLFFARRTECALELLAVSCKFISVNYSISRICYSQNTHLQYRIYYCLGLVLSLVTRDIVIMQHALRYNL